MSEPTPEALARQRFLLLQVLRLSGIALTLFGLAIHAGKLALPTVAGLPIIVVGVIDMLLIPALLARVWKRGR